MLRLHDRQEEKQKLIHKMFSVYTAPQKQSKKFNDDSFSTVNIP